MLIDHDGRVGFKQFVMGIRRAKVSTSRATDTQLEFLFHLMDVEGVGKLHIDDAELLLTDNEQLRKLYLSNVAVAAASSPNKCRSPTFPSPKGAMFTRRTDNLGLPRGKIGVLRPA